MSKPIIRIHDTETNEVIDREMTDAEYKEHLAFIAKNEKAAELEAARESEKTLILEKLGLTADEAKLLLS